MARNGEPSGDTGAPVSLALVATIPGPAAQATRRRPNGALEAEILGILWNSDNALTATQVLVAVPGDLAYTTIMTTLARLNAKGIVTRQSVGRAYAYRPVEGRNEMAAQRMAEVLERTGSRSDVLSRFVARLTPSDLDALRAALRTGRRRS